MDVSLSPADRLCYARIAEHGPIEVSALAVMSGLTLDEARGAVARLADLGVVSTDERGATALPPRPVLSGLARDHEHALATLHQLQDELAVAYDRGARSPLISFLESPEAIEQVVYRIMEASRTEVRAMQLGRIGGPTPERPNSMHDAFPPAVARGCRFRVIYHRELLNDPAGAEAVGQAISMGEQARVLGDVPMTLFFGDDEECLIIVPGHQGRRVIGVSIPPSSLQRAISETFESFWRVAVPVPSWTADRHRDPLGLDSDERVVLSLLAAGLTDERIARELGASERTVRRRILQLQERVGVTTRFQLGAQASRYGWLGGGEADDGELPRERSHQH